MNRRTFSTFHASMSLFSFGLGQAKPFSFDSYGPELADLLENELLKDAQRNGYNREKMERDNLREAFDIIKPVTFNDLVFVIWCGFREKNNNEQAETYRFRKSCRRPLEEYYPFLPLSEYGCPDTQGIFIFREQLDMILQYSLGIDSSQADDLGRKFYRLYTELESRRWSKVNLIDYLFPGHNFERSKADHLNEIGHFIGESRGQSLSYVYCAAIAERALVQLQEKQNGNLSLKKIEAL